MGTLFKDEVWASSYQCFQLITQVIGYFFKQVIKYRSNCLLFEGWICNCIQVLFLLACNGHCIKVHLMDFCNSLFVVCCIPLTEVKDNHFFYMIASGIGLLTNKKKALPGWKRRCDQRCNRQSIGQILGHLLSFAVWPIFLEKFGNFQENISVTNGRVKNPAEAPISDMTLCQDIQWYGIREGCILVLLAWKGVRRVANFLLQFFVPL